MKTYDKIKWVLGILMIFVLILSTNLIDKNNFSRVRDAVVTIYEDRLVANDLIFKMLNSIHEKELAIISEDTDSFKLLNGNINSDIKGYITHYQLTKLTSKEREIFNDLKNNFNLLKSLEKESNYKINNKIITNIISLKDNLIELSEIQLEEGNKQVSISQKAMDTIDLFTKIEVYILIFLAITIQIIIMYSPKTKE